MRVHCKLSAGFDYFIISIGVTGEGSFHHVMFLCTKFLPAFDVYKLYEQQLVTGLDTKQQGRWL